MFIGTKYRGTTERNQSECGTVAFGHSASTKSLLGECKVKREQEACDSR